VQEDWQNCVKTSAKYAFLSTINLTIMSFYCVFTFVLLDTSKRRLLAKP